MKGYLYEFLQETLVNGNNQFLNKSLVDSLKDYLYEFLEDFWKKNSGEISEEFP